VAGVPVAVLLAAIAGLAIIVTNVSGQVTKYLGARQIYDANGILRRCGTTGMAYRHCRRNVPVAGSQAPLKLRALLATVNAKGAAAFETARIAGRVALAVVKAKLIANFRKWNRGETGKDGAQK
jgi:hypothetical protein